MKINKFVFALVIGLGGYFSPVQAQAQMKLGTIDMKAVFDQYFKTK